MRSGCPRDGEQRCGADGAAQFAEMVTLPRSRSKVGGPWILMHTGSLEKMAHSAHAVVRAVGSFGIEATPGSGLLAGGPFARGLHVLLSSRSWAS